MNSPQPSSLDTIENLGSPAKEISVSISTRFLEHFSEQLYSSPNKAFEELLANAWDADARSAYIFLPATLTAHDAAIYVLDDGLSMDLDGLEDLWRVAHSKKAVDATTETGRAIIGKFGIGKLATYTLANKLTYICKAADSVIRTVTMNYATLDSQSQNLMALEKLTVRTLSKTELQSLLQSTDDGKKIYGLISKGVPLPEKPPQWEDEFGGKTPSEPPPSKTWTLVILTALKKKGREIKTGIVRRMIQNSLPLGASLNISLNGKVLSSSKDSLAAIQTWAIGPELQLTEFELPARLDAEGENTETISVKSSATPYPHVTVEGLGEISGRMKLFVERISGGRAEEHAPSNGFFVNVRGRVVNSDGDHQFGLKDLSHSTWSRFRMTVRADNLNQLLAVNREHFKETRELRIFRAFLRAAFNKARKRWMEYDSWSDSGDAILKKYAMLPLLTFRKFVEDATQVGAPSLELLDTAGISDLNSARGTYSDVTRNDLAAVLTGVGFGDFGKLGGLARYSLGSRSVLVNKDHPFISQLLEESGNEAALKDTALIDFLADVQAREIGLSDEQIVELRHVRDKVARAMTKIHRRSGAEIAALLMEMSVHPNFRPFEILVGDALFYLGFDVTKIGGNGQPEGVARALLAPSTKGEVQAYSFTYDAKTSADGKVQTGNCNTAGLVRHRDDYDADYTLLVAPNYAEGALEQECQNGMITPIRAVDLAKLLTMSAEFGAIPLTKLKELFEIYTPADAERWVTELEKWLKGQRTVTIADLIATLKTLDVNFPDAVSVAVLADRCRQLPSHPKVNQSEMRRLLSGLQIIVPELVQVDEDKVLFTVHPNALAASVLKQLNVAKGLE